MLTLGIKLGGISDVIRSICTKVSVVSTVLCLLSVASQKQTATCQELIPGPRPPHVWPQCPPPPANCRALYETTYGTDTSKFYEYNVDGIEIKIFYIKNKEFDLQCSSEVTPGKLSSSTPLPSFIEATTVPSVYITNCGEIRGSYADLLTKLNITEYRKFSLSNHITTILNSSYFVGLNATTLYITSFVSNIVYLTEDFLKPLNDSKELIVSYVSLAPLLLSNRLEIIFMENGISEGAWGGCMNLVDLHISYWRWNTAQGAPPSRWLAHCKKMRKLHISKVAFGLLSEKALAELLVGLKELKILEITGCGLQRLPSDFLMDLINLNVLDLSVNKLMHLPSTLLLPVSKTLHTLVLLGNINLADQCDASDHDDDVVNATTLLRLPSLRLLSLSATNVSRICASWARDMPALTHLQLKSNKIRKIRFGDIKSLGALSCELQMNGNRIKSIVYEEKDYLEIKKNNCSKFSVKLFMNLPLHCDCHSYWFARTLAECPAHVALGSPLRCSSGQPLGDAPLSAMVCERYPDECAPGCRCYWRERRDAVIANCTSVEDGRFPLIPYLRELNAASNRIEQIDFIPTTLVYADLQYNKLSRVSEETAVALFSEGSRRLRLAGNPIICDCENEAFIDTMNHYELQVEDFNMTECADGGDLSGILAGELCALSLTLIVVYSLTPMAILLIMALASFGFFSRHQHTVKVFLYARGWCSCWIHECDIDHDKKYDAFVSYSHTDEYFVYEHLIPQLETEPDGFKLCIHTRDWVVGEWIPVQVAVSVEESRRTIILLSRNFLDSVWGRLEFRTAHNNAIREGRSRVIIILLEDVEKHENLDKELKAYLNTNTYVKWGDPHFWQKLRNALPKRKDECQSQRAGERVALELERIQQQRYPAITASPIEES